MSRSVNNGRGGRCHRTTASQISGGTNTSSALTMPLGGASRRSWTITRGTASAARPMISHGESARPCERWWSVQGVVASMRGIPVRLARPLPVHQAGDHRQAEGHDRDAPENLSYADPLDEAIDQHADQVERYQADDERQDHDRGRLQPRLHAHAPAFAHAASRPVQRTTSVAIMPAALCPG